MKGVQLTVNETLTRASLQARLDSMSLGLFHLTSVALCGMPFFFRGAIGEILKNSQLSYFTVLGGTISLVLGLGLSSWLSALTGRRLLIVSGLSIAGTCSYLSSISVSEEAILTHIFLSFFGCGLSLAPALATTLETFSTSLSGLAVGTLISCFVAGQLFVTFSSYLFDPKDFCSPSSKLCALQLGLELISVPMILAAVTSIVFLQESPYLLTDDCYALNGLLAMMTRGGSTQFKFSPCGVASDHSNFMVKKPVGTTEVVLGLLFGASLTYLISFPSGGGYEGLIAVIPVLGILGLVTVPRIGAITIPFLLMITMSCELVVGTNGFLFNIISQGLAVLGLGFVLLSFEPWADRVALSAFVMAVGEVGASCWPLFVNIHTETEEIAFAVIFGIAGIVAMMFLPLRSSECETGGPKFPKIPIIQYGST